MVNVFEHFNLCVQSTLRSRIDGGGGLGKFIKSNKRGEGGGGIREGGQIFIIFTTKIWLFVTKSACKRALRSFGRENC